MTGHIAERVRREELYEYADERFRELARELDVVGDFDPRMYDPPGPVAEAFLNTALTATSSALTAILMGPLGGGKTTTCMFMRMVLASRGPIAWHPATRKPTRMCRAVVVRDTFRQTEKTVLASWLKAFPKNYPGSTTIGGNDRPFTHTLNFMGHDGVRVEAITEFMGLNDQSIAEVLKGTEYSVGWLNEVDTHNDRAIDELEQRLGRYPSADMLLTRRQVAELEARLREEGHLGAGERLHAPETRTRALIGDMNAPTIDNWTYEKLVTNRAPDRLFFRQPSGMSPDAENLFALASDYYTDIAARQDERYVRRMVHNEFGYSLAGKAVHPSFDPHRHVASSELGYVEGMDLLVGVDVSTGGLSPAAMIGQLTKRVRLIDECYLGQGVGAGRFAEGLQQLFNERYPNVPRRRVQLWGDPAAIGGNDSEAGQLDAADAIAAALGVPFRVPFGGSNQLSTRLGAVDLELRGYLAPESALLISPRCKLYIGGISGKYRYRRKSEHSTSSNEYDDLPEKAHPWSDLQDAGQYLIGGARGHRNTLAGAPGGKDGRWSSQDGEGDQGWKSQRRSGFDPHKVGAR